MIIRNLKGNRLLPYAYYTTLLRIIKTLQIRDDISETRYEDYEPTKPRRKTNVQNS